MEEGRSIIGTLGQWLPRLRWPHTTDSNPSPVSTSGASGVRALRLFLPLLLVACAAGLAVDSIAGAGVVTVTAPEGLNLRAAPSTEAAVLALIPYGSVLTLTGDPTSDHWYPVSFGTFSGWAFGSYLTLGQVNPTAAQLATPITQAPFTTTTFTAPAPSAQSSPLLSAVASAPSALVGAPATSSGATMTVTADMLNLRAGPDKSAQVLTQMPQGSSVRVTGPASANNWYPVVYNGMSGWADATYLSSGAAAAATPPSTASGALSASSFSTAMMGMAGPPEAGSEVASAPPGTLGRFIWPVAGRRITTVFKSIHRAIDIDQYPSGGNPVWAIADGLVTFAGGDSCCSYGLYVIIQHANGFSSLYAHFSALEVSQGQVVKQGTEIGKSGNTGNSTGAHLHFAIFYNGVPLDPLTVLPQDSVQIWPNAGREAAS